MEPLVRVAGPADYPALHRCMQDVFDENPGQKTADFNSELWHWQYQQIPGGSMVLISEVDGAMAGYYHVLLPTLNYDGVATRVGMVQDVGTKAEYRKLGIFKKVGGVALDEMRARGVEFIYTFPNQRSLPSFIRNHAYSVVCQVPVMVLPLKLGPLARGRIAEKVPPLAGLVGLLAAAATPLFRALFTRKERLEAGETVERLPAVTEEMERLAAGLTRQTRIALDRNARYLDWRFLRKPGGTYEIWGLRRAGALLATVATRTADILGSRCLLFMDFGCEPGGEAAVRRLVTERLEAAARTGHALSLAMGLHPLFPALAQLGFRRVPERFNPRIFNLVTREVTGRGRPLLLEPQNWTITLADYDVY